MEQKRPKIVGYYNYTVILTYAGFACAVIGIINAVKGNMQLALSLLMACGFCDMFDGAIASTMKRTPEEKSFGAHIDSLSDMTAFGILPAVILYGFGLQNFWGYAAMIFYALCALIRLAYFDVQEMFNIRKEGEKRTHFLGLPVTNSAIILPGLMVINIFLKINNMYFYLVAMLLVAIAFITPFRMKKLYMPWLIIPAIIGIAFFVLLVIFGGALNA